MKQTRSPTSRSLDYLRNEGWFCSVVEQTIRGKGIVFKRDLWNCADILCLREEEILAVQTTSGSNVSSRVKKVTECEALPRIRKAGILFHIHGWAKLKAGWTLRIIDVS